MQRTPLLNVPTDRQSGFSLMELAVVLMIMGILMGGVLVSVSQTTLNARRATALAQLRMVEEALYGFAATNGRLPCPASDTSNGLEDGTPGNCAYAHGFVPATSLSISGQTNDDGLLLDPWNNPLRYSVVTSANTASPGNPDFTYYDPNSDNETIRAFFARTTPIDPTEMLKICDEADASGTCIGTWVSNSAPAVVMSMGENWASYSSDNESTNASASNNLLGGYPVHADAELIFISTTYIEDQFDDQLVWLSPYILFNRMVTAGKLP